MIIRIKNLKVRALIGLEDWERKEKQNLLIHAELHIDGKKSGQSDAIEDTLDYKEVTDKILDLAQNSEFFLLEKMAYSILELILKNPKVLKARVEVDKPSSFFPCDSVSVECSSGELH